MIKYPKKSAETKRRWEQGLIKPSMIGKHHSEETRKKMSEKAKGRK